MPYEHECAAKPQTYQDDNKAKLEAESRLTNVVVNNHPLNRLPVARLTFRPIHDLSSSSWNHAIVLLEHVGRRQRPAI